GWLISPSARTCRHATTPDRTPHQGNRWTRQGKAEMTPPSFRLRPIMKQGTAAGLPETWTHYPSVEDARAGAKLMYQNDRVLRVMVVTDSAGSFVEWIER